MKCSYGSYVKKKTLLLFLSFHLLFFRGLFDLLASSIPDLVIRQGTSLPVPIHFEFGSGTALGWREWVDSELSDAGFMGLLQRVGVLKAIVSSRCLSNFRDLFNLRHLVRWWCTTTQTFFFSYGEVIVTLEDVANPLLLPILGDVDFTTL